MTDTLPFLTAGIIFGLTAGLSPGPLLTLVITETLRHNEQEGIKVAIAPLLTDIPIIAVTLFVLSKMANSDTALGIIALLGGIFLFYLGCESIKTRGLDVDIQNLKPQSIKKGMIINSLSPHPYIFWLTVGAPTAMSAYKTGITALILFIAAFYGLLVGSKIAAALITDKSRDFLKNKVYIWTMRTLGLVLLGFAVFFVKAGLKFLGVI